MSQSYLDSKITDTAHAFQVACASIHDRMAWPSYKTSSITLTVTYSGDKSECYLEMTAGYSLNVKASTLEALLSEVGHRLDFNQQEEARMSLTALPPPTPEEIVETNGESES